MTSLPTRGQRMPRTERRAQLLDAAQSVFVARGYHAAAMDEIADRAGVSKPVLYQHFPGKLELYLALLDQHCDTLERLVREALAKPAADNHDRVMATIAAYYEFVSREGAAFRMVFESDLTGVPQVRTRLDNVELACAEMIADVISSDTGIDDERAMLLGTALAGMAQITARHWLGQNGTLSRDDAATLIGALAWRGLGRFPWSPGKDPTPRRVGTRNPSQQKGGSAVEVTIGVQNVAREISIETDASAADVHKAVQAAISEGGVLELTDSKGRKVFVPGHALGWVLIGESERGKVGFGRE